MLWNSWKETFIAIKRYKIEELFCVKETEGEGSRARGARQGERRLLVTAYLRMCGNNSIETAPQRTGPRMVEDPHACTLHSKTALLLATPPGYYPHKISKCLGSAIQGWRGVREWQRVAEDARRCAAAPDRMKH